MLAADRQFRSLEANDPELVTEEACCGNLKTNVAASPISTVAVLRDEHPSWPRLSRSQ